MLHIYNFILPLFSRCNNMVGGLHLDPTKSGHSYRFRNSYLNLAYSRFFQLFSTYLGLLSKTVRATVESVEAYECTVVQESGAGLRQGDC